MIDFIVENTRLLPIANDIIPELPQVGYSLNCAFVIKAECSRNRRVSFLTVICGGNKHDLIFNISPHNIRW